MEEADKDWVTIRMVGGWVFLLVPAHPGSPGQRAVKRSWCCCSYSNVIVSIFLKLPASSMSVATCIYLVFEYMTCYQTAFTSACAWLSKKILQLSAGLSKSLRTRLRKQKNPQCICLCARQQPKSHCKQTVYWPICGTSTRPWSTIIGWWQLWI